ncbi:MAG: helix-turn-helix domain-containing protein [Ktedonobacterales bacterium]|nr:helix-turn-helix domain-containing protein [Ktedonobacterales bacterium]
MHPGKYLTARAVAESLGVSVATVYAYVSRGLIRSEAGADASKRSRRYLGDDVQKLLDQKRFRHDPGEAAASAMHWGAPVLESALTHITEAGLHYRGQNAITLATTSTIEQVAALMWLGDSARAHDLFACPPHEILAAIWPQIPRDGLPGQRLTIALALASAHDTAAYDLDLRFGNVAATGARILALLAAVLADDPGMQAPIADELARQWCPAQPAARELLSAALILCADHELNASAFVARVVASADAHLYLVVTAGLAALGGFKHGGHTGLVEAFLSEVGESAAARQVISQRLRRGVCIPGFGHRLYPDGDPRGAALLRLLNAHLPTAPATALANMVAAEVQRVTGKAPTIDFGLVALARAIGLPDGGALAMFALGRTVGWIGHAIEQYHTGQLIRPRAKYVGL